MMSFIIASANSLLVPDRHKNLRAELVGESVHETLVPGEGHLRVTCNSRRVIQDLLHEHCGARSSSGVASAVTRKHVQLHNAGVLRQRVLIHAEAIRVREVVRQLTHHLVDVAIGGVALYGDLRLQRRRRVVGGGWEGCRVGLRQEGGNACGSWTREEFRDSLVVVGRAAGGTAGALSPQDTGVDEAGAGRSQGEAPVQHDELYDDDPEEEDLGGEEECLRYWSSQGGWSSSAAWERGQLEVGERARLCRHAFILVMPACASSHRPSSQAR